MLKYLFEVRYTDGERFKQPKEDISVKDPKRSSFYDVLNSGKEIKTFSLRRFLDKWTLDLETGLFNHNGIEFQLEEIPSVGKRTLYFQRQHQHDANAKFVANKDGKYEMNKLTESAHRVIYVLGYEIDGKKYLVAIK